MSLIAGTVWNATGTVTFNATTTGKTITTNGTVFTGGVTFNGVGGVWTLGSALTSNAGITVTAGTLNTSGSNYAVSCTVLTTASSANAILTLNASTVTASGTSTVFGASSVLNAGTSQINLTGTGTMNFTGGGKTFYNVTFSADAAAFTCTINSANTFNNLTFSAPLGEGAKSVSFAESQTVNGTFTGSGSSQTFRIFYRSNTLGTTRTLTLANPATLSNCDFRDITAATSAITATSSGGDCGGNTNITFPAAKTVYWNLAGAQNWSATGWATSSGGSPAAANFPLAQDTAVFNNTGSVTGTITINAAWNIGTVNMSGRTSAMTLAAGSNAPNIYGSWSNGTGTTLTGTGALVFTGRGNTQQILGNGVTFAQSITITNIGGTVQLTSAVTTDVARQITLSNGTLDLQSYTLTTGLFTSSASAEARTIAFGTGNITVGNTAGGSVWITGPTGLTTTGSKTVNVSYAGAIGTTITPGALDETQAVDFNITAGTYALTITSTGRTRNLNFTGFAGSVVNTAIVIYGDLVLASGATYTAGANGWLFSSTSGTPRTITTNAKTMDFPLTFNGVGGSWVLQDALTMGSARTLTHTNGTINLNGKTLTVGTAYTTGTGTKDLTFNGGTLICPTAAATAFNNAAPTGYTTTAGTGTGTISMTAATAKTFQGGGSTYNCTINQGGAGALTITGANTFNDITNTVQPASVLFTAGTTTTFNNFNLNGTAGNLITIASATAATHTLSKASGTVSCDYLSITNSIATGGAAWYAGANSTNGGGNTGWNFSAPSGTQTLLPSLVTNTNVFYLTTITQTGPPQTLTPSLYTNANVFYTPTVSAAYTLAPALYVNPNTFYTPTVAAGAVNLAPALYTNTNTFYSPTVSVGAVDLAPALFVNTNAFYAPAVTAAYTLAPALFANTNTFYTPTVSAAYTLAPALYASTNVFYSPTITQTGGTQTLLPNLYVNTNVFYSATVTPGAVNIAPALYVNPNVFYAATVTPGAVDLAPALYANANVFYGPTVSAAYTIAPDLFINQNTFYTAQLVYPQFVYPDLFANTNTFYNAFCYLYPFHPNDVRPGGPNAASGPRQAMPQAPNAARQNIPLSSSGRQSMPAAPNAGRQNLPLSSSVRQPMPFE